MPEPIILADDLFRRSGATVTDGSGISSAARMRDWRDDEQATRAFTTNWDTVVDLGSGVTARAEALALLNHNLTSIGLSAASVRVSYSDDGSTWTDAYYGTVTASVKDHVVTWIHDGAHRYWRVRLEPGTGTPSASGAIGELLLGLPIVFPDPPGWDGFDPRGEEPVEYARRDPLPLTQHTVAYVEREIPLHWPILAETFLEATGSLAAFRTWYETYGSKGVPFVWAWRVGAAFDRDVLWGWLKGAADRPFVHPPDSYTLNSYRSLDMTVMGRRRS